MTGTKNKNIKIIAASVTGQQHIANNIPCQDYYQYANGLNIVAIVSDGAGSAKFGKIGAKTLCSTLCDLLKNARFNNIENQIIEALKISRQKLCFHRFNKTKSEESLPLFAATVVGVIYKQNKGVFFHIGDGAALSLDKEGFFTASRPENGSFSCETFFFTQQAWRENLRFTNINNAQSIMLMSDGLTSFAFRSDFSNIEDKFINPINNFLLSENNNSKAKKALENTLKNPKAQKLNPDDKTLVWIKVA